MGSYVQRLQNFYTSGTIMTLIIRAARPRKSKRVAWRGEEERGACRTRSSSFRDRTPDLDRTARHHRAAHPEIPGLRLRQEPTRRGSTPSMTIAAAKTSGGPTTS